MGLCVRLCVGLCVGLWVGFVCRNYVYGLSVGVVFKGSVIRSVCRGVCRVCVYRGLFRG